MHAAVLLLCSAVDVLGATCLPWVCPSLGQTPCRTRHCCGRGLLAGGRRALPHAVCNALPRVSPQLPRQRYSAEVWAGSGPLRGTIAPPTPSNTSLAEEPELSGLVLVGHMAAGVDAGAGLVPHYRLRPGPALQESILGAGRETPWEAMSDLMRHLPPPPQKKTKHTPTHHHHPGFLRR